MSWSFSRWLCGGGLLLSLVMAEGCASQERMRRLPLDAGASLMLRGTPMLAYGFARRSLRACRLKIEWLRVYPGGWIILAHRGPSAFSAGERVRLVGSARSLSSTEIALVVRRVLATNVFANTQGHFRCLVRHLRFWNRQARLESNAR